MMSARFGQLSEKNQKKTNKKIIYDNLARGTRIKCSSENKEDYYEIEIYGLNSIDRDSRDSFIMITHSKEGSRHEVVFVLDCGHQYKSQEGVHINLTNASKEVLGSCQSCKTYFEDLNHTEISPLYTGVYTIDADQSWAQVRRDLKKTLFSDYPTVEYSELSELSSPPHRSSNSSRKTGNPPASMRKSAALSENLNSKA